MPNASTQSDIRQRPPRVLIVEDDENIAELLAIELKKAGYQVNVANDGAEALTIALPALPDVIVLDLAMPNLDGFGFLARRRSYATVAKAPVIVLSAHQRAGDVTRALGLGAADYMTKPVDIPRLLRRLNLLLPAEIRVTRRATAVVW
ncbi:MAG: response regulator [Caulobacter sp.]|nr:response regulator [Caulobacter sp.]